MKHLSVVFLLVCIALVPSILSFYYGVWYGRGTNLTFGDWFFAFFITSILIVGTVGLIDHEYTIKNKVNDD